MSTFYGVEILLKNHTETAQSPTKQESREVEAMVEGDGRTLWWQWRADLRSPPVSTAPSPPRVSHGHVLVMSCPGRWEERELTLQLTSLKT